MKLVASLIVRDELGRYLEECVGHLLEFCDQVVVLDDGSTDGTYEWLQGRTGVTVHRNDTSRFFEHEGRARQELLERTLAATPSHVLSVDCDEFVADGAAVRRACEGPGDVWTLVMEEVWELDGDCLCIREDGGWRAHPVPVLYRVPGSQYVADWKIQDRALACGRVPAAVERLAGRAAGPITDLLHFGWTNEGERVARHARYAEADGGRFHASSHLASILWPPERVQLRGREWPAGLAARRADLTARVSLANAARR